MSKKNVVRKFLSVFGVFLVLLFMLGTANAEEQYIIDNADLFTQAELRLLTERATSLEKANSAKVMIYVDEEFPVEDALEFAKNKYAEYHLPNNGVMIVLATSGSIAASSNNPSITNQIDSTLDSVMSLLEDGKLAEGLIELQSKFIQHLGGAKVVEQTATTVNQQKTTSPIVYVWSVGVSVAFIILCIQNHFRNKKAEEALEAEKEKNASWQNEIEAQKQELYQEISKERNAKLAQERNAKIIKEELQAAQEEIRAYELDFEVIRNLYPNIVSEIEEYYRKKQEEADKKRAEEYDSCYREVMAQPVTREQLASLKNVLREYERLSANEKQWTSTDIAVLKENLQKAEEMQKKHEEAIERARCKKLAKEFEEAVRDLQNSAYSFNVEERYSRVERLLRKYQGLPMLARNMLDVSFMQLWQQFYTKIEYDWKEEQKRREAERRREAEERRQREERERREAEERRLREEQERRQREERERRRRMNSSSGSSRSFSSSGSSSGSSRNFGGRSSGSSRSFGGGSSRGGGAGRKF